MPRNSGAAAFCKGALAGLGALGAATRSAGAAPAFHRIRALAREIGGRDLCFNDAQKAPYLRQRMLDDLEGLIMRISLMLALLWREKYRFGRLAFCRACKTVAARFFSHMMTDSRIAFLRNSSSSSSYSNNNNNNGKTKTHLLAAWRHSYRAALSRYAMMQPVHVVKRYAG